MILCTALYYTGSLERGDLIVRDNRFYPGKYVETFPIWWQYVRRHYPDVPVVLLCDSASPIPIQPLLDKHLGSEPYETFDLPAQLYDLMSQPGAPKVFVKVMTEHCGKYFWPMQRNLVEAIILAYALNEDLFWLDSDAFLNTDIRPLVRDFDVAAPRIAHHQQTLDSVCTYISACRLRDMADFEINLPEFLRKLLANGPTNTRMHVFQEAGLYKLFCYGKTRILAPDIELTHLSNYPNFMSFLHRNPLPTEEFETLRYMLAKLDMSRLEGVDLNFHDMNCPAEGLAGSK